MTEKIKATEPKKEISPRGKAAQRGVAQRMRYEKEKKKVKELEKTNREYLIVFPSKDSWWKMGGVSALYYNYYLVKHLGRNEKLRPDSDYFSKFSTGVVSINDINQLEKDLWRVKKIGLNKDLSTETIKYFNLGYKLSDETVYGMIHMQEILERRLNQMVMPNSPIPKLYAALREGLRLTYITNKETPRVARELLGRQMTERARTTVVNYSLLANRVIPRREGLKKIWLSVSMLMSDLETMSDLKIWPTKRCVAVGKYWAEALVILRKELGIKEDGTAMETVAAKTNHE